MGLLTGQTFINRHVKQKQVTIIEESSVFDEVMDKVTDGMFKVILFGGIPYFLWICIQFVIKF